MFLSFLHEIAPLDLWLAVPFVFSAATTFSLMVYSYEKRRTPSGAVLFAWMCMISTVWTICYIGVLLSPDTSGKLFWTKMTYFGGQYSSVSVYLFAARYSRADTGTSAKAIVGYIFSGALIILLVLTNDFHHLMWTTAVLEGPVLRLTYGPGYWLTLIYPYSFTAASIVVLLRSYFSSQGVNRQRTRLLAFGIAVPIVVSIGNDVIGLVLVKGFDATVFSLVITSIVFARALFRFRALEFPPIASNAVIENIRDGVIVLNGKEQIVSINPAGLRMLEKRMEEVVDADYSLILRSWSETAWKKWNQKETAFEIKRLSAEIEQSYEFHYIDIHDNKRQKIGILVMIYDISDRKQLEAQLEALAISDPLTGCYNRRHFMTLANRELELARRHRRPVAAVMIDLDHFKLVNDHYGHQAGDQVLQEVVRLCMKHTRQTDLFARYGGEEFVFLLSDLAPARAVEFAERMRELIASLEWLTENGPVQVTASLGVAALAEPGDVTLDQLVSDADAAMYQAKQDGRNRVRSQSPREQAGDEHGQTEED